MNELINDEAVCRTAPATPGLLINLSYEYILSKLIDCLKRNAAKYF